MRATLAAISVLAVAPRFVGCGGSGSSSDGNGSTMLSLSIGGEAPVTIAVAPFAAQQSGGIAIQAMSSTATVFISFSQQLLASGSMLPIGVSASQAAVWGKDPSVQQPVTAMSGTLAIDNLDLAPGGLFSMRIIDAEKPADTFQPSIRIDGSLMGMWNSVQ